jgi:type I restriction enzyme S subunit
VSNQSEWKEVILRDLCKSVRYGYTAKAQDEPVGPKFLRITDIVPNLVDWASVPYCEINPENIEKYRLQEGDIVIARTGATTGYAKWVKDPPEAVFASYLVRLRIAGEHDSRYVGFVVESDTYKQFIMTNVGGAAQPNANAQVLTSFPLLLPPLPTQRKIAAILSAYDDLIENNTRRIAILEEMARLLYREWFVHFRFPGHEEVAMVDSELGPIPDGWKAKQLGNIAEEVRRSVEPEEVDPETPYLGLAHLPEKSIALSDWNTAKEAGSTKLAFQKGEILFGKIRPYLHKVVVAPVDGICSTDTIVIVPRSPEYFALVLTCVSSGEFVEYATQTSQGTKMPRADWKVLVKYPIVLPSQPMLSRYNELVENIVAQIQNMIFRNRNLRRTRDLLLPRLISGEVDVSDLDL